MSNNYYQQGVMALQKSRRQRGVILAPKGFQKLQEALRHSEIQENFGDRYTIQTLSEQTGLAPRTVAKVLAREAGVDKRTLDCFFKAFSLELSSSDYVIADHYNRLFYPTQIDVSTEIRTQLLEMLNQTLFTTLNLKIFVKQSQWNEEMNCYHSHELFDEITTVLEDYIDVFIAWITVLGGVALGCAPGTAVPSTGEPPARGCLDDTQRQSTLPDYPFNILSITDYVTTLADRLEPYAKSLRNGLDKTAESCLRG